MRGVIYCYKNRANNKCYIGQTTNEDRRRKSFLSVNGLYTSQKGKKLSKIDQARKKYGIESFEYSVLEEVISDNQEELVNKLNELEEKYIKKYDSIDKGYNILSGGGSYIRTEEIIQHIKEGISKSEKTVKRISKVCNKIQRDLVLLPDNFTLEPKCGLLYLCLQEFVEIGSNKCSPSLEELEKTSGMSVPTVRRVLADLESAGYIKIEHVSNHMEYTFTDISGINIPVGLLHNGDLSLSTRYTLIGMYPYFDTALPNIGMTDISNRSLATKINTAESVIRKANKELISLGMMQLIDYEKSKFKVYYLHIFDVPNESILSTVDTSEVTEELIAEYEDKREFVQVLKNHEDRLGEHDDRLNEQGGEISELKNIVKEQGKLIEKLMAERQSDKIEYTL